MTIVTNQGGTILGREPVMILAVVQAGLALAVAFGLNWTGQQVALFIAFTASVLGLIARQAVTPSAAPVLEIGTPVTTPAGSAAIVSGASTSSRRGH